MQLQLELSTLTKAAAYSLQIVWANGCVNESNPLTLNFKSNPKPIITANRSLFICDSNTLELTSSPAVNYLWNTNQNATNH